MTTVWKPQKKQAIFLARPEYEALYGGAAGGGKSDALLAEYARRSGKPVLEYQAPEAEGFDNYNKFYEEL